MAQQASSSGYKHYTREGRIMTVEDSFNKGISFTDTPLDAGYVKNLVNFNLTKDGSTLTPRGGLQNSLVWDTLLQDKLSTNTIWNELGAPCIYYIGTTLVTNTDTGSTNLYKFAIIGRNTDLQILGLGTALDMNTAVLLIFDGGITPAIATNQNTNVAAVIGANVQRAHGVYITSYIKQDPLLTSIDGCIYIPIIRKNLSTGVTTRKFGYVNIQVNNAKAYTWKIDDIVPKEIQPSQAINYGYNMLKDNPYTFTNTTTTTGGLILGGVIPRDKNGNVVFTSKVGEEVTFELNYQYPTTDASKQYYVEWSINDLETNADSVIVKSILNNPTAYTPGSAITLGLAPSFKSFSLIVKVFYKDVIDAYRTANPNATQADIDNLAPIKAIVLASYYLTADNNSSTQNVTPKSFDLPSATGMCAWQQRLVLWGVQNAKTTLFISDPNTPSYIPYPNNSEILPDNIVTAVPYMGKLLVFTYNSLYLLTMNVDGLTYTTKCIQDNLVMTDDDALTIRTVRNMVYFRSGNYFFMVVPNSYAGAGELQLAPISNLITPLLDDFSKYMTKMIDDVYNLPNMFDLISANNDTYDFTLVDYCNFLDGNKMRNVYKWRINVTKMNTTTSYFLDTVLIYDTVLRVWTVNMYQSNPYRMKAYEFNVADNTIYANLIATNGTVTGFGIVKTSALSAEDTFHLDSTNLVKMFPNYQYIDTGYRKHSSQHKKRFREIQFTINNLSHTILDYYSAVYIDDDTRKDMYTYNTIHITDKNDPNYGVVFVERAMNAPSTVYGETLLSDTPDAWKLDFSKFPELTIAKVSFRISGKGYNGKLKLLSKNNDMYELITTNWVYRMMYAR